LLTLPQVKFRGPFDFSWRSWARAAMMTRWRAVGQQCCGCPMSVSRPGPSLPQNQERTEQELLNLIVNGTRDSRIATARQRLPTTPEGLAVSGYAPRSPFALNGPVPTAATIRAEVDLIVAIAGRMRSQRALGNDLALGR